MDLKKAIKNFWTPRMTMEEFESAHTRNHYPVEIQSVIYDDEAPRMPLRVMAIVTPRFTSRHEKINLDWIVWNQYGECFSDGTRKRELDLIHPNISEIASAQICTVSIIVVALVIICTSIWN